MDRVRNLQISNVTEVLGCSYGGQKLSDTDY